MRPLRRIPSPQTLVEVTTRTVHGRLLLLPSPELNEIVVGVLGRAQRFSGVRICGAVFLSNHYHLLLVVDDAQQLASFMTYVNSNLAREIGRRVGWREKFWSRRYQAIIVSAEEGAQRERLKYLLSNSVKEGLVERPGDWPGVNSVQSLLTGEPLRGYWFDRSSAIFAPRRNQEVDRLRFATPEAVLLAPLPCWQELPLANQRRRIADILEEIEVEMTQQRPAESSAPVGVEALKARDPHDMPRVSKRSPAPLFHAATRRAYLELYEGYRLFVRAFRIASEQLRSGDRCAVFPAGCFPPALPFAGG